MNNSKVLLHTLAIVSVWALVVQVSHGQGFASGGVAAVVNGEKISIAEVQKLLQRDTPPVHPLTTKQKQELWEMALDMLINDTLMRQFLEKNASPVSKEEVKKELDGLYQALAKQKMSYSQFLKNSNQTDEQLKEEIVARLQWKEYVTKRLPEPLIKKYYDANKVFFDKIFVRARHILLRVPEDAGAAKKQEVKTQIEKLRQSIVAGQTKFEDAAKKYSECPSKEKGGDIGHFPYKFVVAEPFARAAFSMKVGDISDVVETEFGYHIIQVTERTKGEPSTFEENRDLVRDVYAQDLQLSQSIIAEQRQKAKIEVLAPGY